MTTKNILMAALLLLAGLAVTPTASADLSQPICSIQACVVDKACDAIQADCSVECTMTAEASSVQSCIPVCPMTADMGASSVYCNPCPWQYIDDGIRLDTTQSAYYCPLPCTQWENGSNPCLPCVRLDTTSEASLDLADIRCPPPINPCILWPHVGDLGCPVCPWPPGSLQACPIWPGCQVTDLCGVCDMLAADPCHPDLCNLRDRECYPHPMPVSCERGPDAGEGIVFDTEDYAIDMTLITLCGLVLPEAGVAVEETGDAAYYAASQGFATADYARDFFTVSCCTNFDDHGLGAAVVGTASNQLEITCDFLLGNGPACSTGGGPAPAACPVSGPDMGGVVGDTLDFADASCANTMGGTAATAAAATALASDVAGSVVGSAEALVDSVSGFAGERVDDANAFAAETQGNAETAVLIAEDYAATAVIVTCNYAVGNPTCTV